MASLLAKFRIDYSDVIVIPDVTKKAGQEIKTEFKTIMDKIKVAKDDFLATLILSMIALNSVFISCPALLVTSVMTITSE